MVSTTLVKNYHLCYTSSISTTMMNNVDYITPIPLHVEDEVTKALRLFRKYIRKDEEDTLNFIIKNHGTIPILQRAIEYAGERRVREIEIRLSKDMEDEDISLELVVYVNEYDEDASKLWNELSKIAEKVAKDMKREDILCNVLHIIVMPIQLYNYK